MDISAYVDKDFEHPDPRREYDKAFLDEQAERYAQIFDCFKRYAKQDILKDVILWGITDRMTWKNNFPAPGRTDSPLLFDNDGKPKPAFDKLLEL